MTPAFAPHDYLEVRYDLDRYILVLPSHPYEPAQQDAVA